MKRNIGIGLFILHLVLPILALILVPLFGFPAEINTVLIGLSFVGGPDVLLIAAIAVLGKDGVAELMGKAGNTIRKLTRWDSVTRQRYTIGLWVMVVSLLLPTVLLFFWSESVVTVDGGPGWGFYVLITSTFAFIGAVLSMGEPFWARIQAMFTWEARIEFPNETRQDD